MKLIREPLFSFVLIGAAIYLLYAAFAEPTSALEDKTIVVSAAEIEQMRSDWQKRWNRPPTAEELQGQIQRHVHEMVLYREALTMGLNQHDAVIRRRLGQKLEFAARDLVSLAQPGDAELQAYLDQHAARYQHPARYSFTQLFFDPDKRGDATLTDAEATKAELIAGGQTAGDTAELGDTFMLEQHYTAKDPAQIRKLFGSGFTDSLLELSPGQWHGPVLSGYGTHLVYVEEVAEALPARLDEVRERVFGDWQQDRSELLGQQFYDGLRAQYRVNIEQPQAGRDADPAGAREPAIAGDRSDAASPAALAARS